MFRSLLAAFLAAFVLIAGTASSAVAEVAREITWDSLVPPAPPLADPFAHLSTDRRFELEALAHLREVRVRGLVSDVAPEVEEALELTYKLESEGVDVDSLLSQYAAFMAEIERRNELVVGGLDRKLVRLPGYALPLEFSETGVMEFLLVPYIGACIHVPPPPPNQMVFVRLSQTFKADDLYTPVWVTGRMTVKRTSQSLSFVDGQSSVVAGYTLDGIRVEPYNQ